MELRLKVASHGGTVELTARQREHMARSTLGRVLLRVRDGDTSKRPNIKLAAGRTGGS